MKFKLIKKTMKIMNLKYKKLNKNPKLYNQNFKNVKYNYIKYNIIYYTYIYKQNQKLLENKKTILIITKNKLKMM